LNTPSDLGGLLASRLASAAQLLELVRSDGRLLEDTTRAAAQTAAAIQAGGTLFICGNGGSAGEATHLSGPFLDKKRRPLPAVALGFDTAAATAVSNDFSFAEVFARQLQALARPGDVLWALSTSGRSPNIARALETAAEQGVFRVLITGERGRQLADQAEVVLAVPSGETPRIQEIHLMLGHFLCEAVEAIAGGSEARRLGPRSPNG
jgi:D-sedoheptulose 7-phosphate isomerase